MARRNSRHVAWVVTLTSLILPVVTASTAAAATSTERWAGGDRYGTAAAAAAASWSGSPSPATAFIATGESFADALAGSSAAATAGGPILLTMRDSLPVATREELKILAPGNIVILGGPAAISSNVEAQLASLTKGTVTRLAGNDRYATAAEISRATFAAPSGVAFVAGGDGFADALAVGPVAGQKKAPVLLVTATSIPDGTASELRRLGPSKIFVVGGSLSVSDDVLRQLGQFAASVQRVAGGTRFGTSASVSSTFFTGGAATVFLATGMSFADALAGGPAAARLSGPILLVERNCVPQEVETELQRLAPSRIVILGGSNSVGTGAAGQSVCGPPQTGPMRFIFAGKQNGDTHWQIYVMNTDGTGLTRLTNDNWDNLSPTWAPNGALIAWSGGEHVWVAAPDGTGRRDIGSGMFPSWAPDSRRIVYAALENKAVVRVSNADGGGQVDVGSGLGPVWSPLGDQIAFYNIVGNNGFDIFQVHPDGSGLTDLTPVADDQRAPRWSPEGTAIAYESGRTDTRVWVMFPGGGGGHRVDTTTSREGLGAGNFQMWRPNTNDLVVLRDNGISTDAIRVGVIGGSEQFIGRPANSAEWSPDGTQVAMSYSGPLVVANADGSSPHTLNPSVYIDNAQWEPSR